MSSVFLLLLLPLKKNMCSSSYFNNSRGDVAVSHSEEMFCLPSAAGISLHTTQAISFHCGQAVIIFEICVVKFQGCCLSPCPYQWLKSPQHVRLASLEAFSTSGKKYPEEMELKNWVFRLPCIIGTFHKSVSVNFAVCI